MWHVWGARQVHTEVFVGRDLKERNHLEERRADIQMDLRSNDSQGLDLPQPFLRS